MEMSKQEQMTATLGLEYSLGHKPDPAFLHTSADEAKAEQLSGLTLGLFS